MYILTLNCQENTYQCYLLAALPSSVRSLRAMGVRLVSLANDHIRQDGDQGTTATLRALEAANIRWLGLNGKQHEIIVMKGQKIGFLAFCGVHGQCIEPSSMPFAPLKYSPKVASLAVSELKEVSVSPKITVPFPK